jgi:oligosaccharyltransferase complex subunit beta
MAALRLLLLLAAASLLVVASRGDASGAGPRGRKLLVLVDDLAVRSSHSAFFGSLQARGLDLEFRLADDPKLSLHRYGQYLYDGLVLFAPSTPRNYSAPPSLPDLPPRDESVVRTLMGPDPIRDSVELDWFW